MRHMADGKRNNAVTLVEMLVVLGIITVLAGIVLTATLRVDNQAKERALANAFALLNSVLREYYEAESKFPVQAERDSNNRLLHVETMMQRLRTVPACREVLDKLSGTTAKSQEIARAIPAPLHTSHVTNSTLKNNPMMAKSNDTDATHFMAHRCLFPSPAFTKYTANKAGTENSANEARPRSVPRPQMAKGAATNMAPKIHCRI